MILQHMVTIVRWPGAAALAAGVPLAALVAAAPGTAHAAPAKRTAVAKGAVWAAPLKARDFDLRRGADRSAPLRALAGRLRRTGVGALLGASGSSRLGRGCGKAAAVPSGAQVYCFDRADTATRAWIPQGVTSVSDAVAGERWAGGDRPLVVSWHENGKVRITFVDPARRRYRHVLLVEPVMKGRHVTYRDIKVHAGGIAWYGDRLYVADTWRGLREFDMRQIYDLARSKAGSTGHAGRVGLHRGKYYAHGYRFVMPQTGDRRFVRGAPARARGRGRCACRGWASTGPGRRTSSSRASTAARARRGDASSPGRWRRWRGAGPPAPPGGDPAGRPDPGRGQDPRPLVVHPGPGHQARPAPHDPAGPERMGPGEVPDDLARPRGSVVLPWPAPDLDDRGTSEQAGAMEFPREPMRVRSQTDPTAATPSAAPIQAVDR